MSQYKTIGGKEIMISTDPHTAHVVISFKEGGAVPQELSGVFTSKVFAETAVRSYLSRQKVEAEKPVMDEAEKAKLKWEKKQAKSNETKED